MEKLLTQKTKRLGQLKLQVVIMILINILGYCIYAIPIKQKQIWPYICCMILHMINMLCLTENVCCVVVVLVLLTRNWLVTSKIHDIKFAFMCLELSHVAYFMEDIILNKN